MNDTAPRQLESSCAGIGFRAMLRPDPAAPLVYLVHGRAGDRRVMWPFQRIAPERASVVALEAPSADPRGGFSWWLVDDVAGRDRAIAAAGTGNKDVRGDVIEQAEIAYQQGDFRRAEVAALDSETLGMVITLMDVHAAGTSTREEWVRAKLGDRTLGFNDGELKRMLSEAGLREVQGIRWDRPARALRAVYEEVARGS